MSSFLFTSQLLITTTNSTLDIIWDDNLYTDAIMILFQDDDDDNNRSDAHQEGKNEAEEQLPYVWGTEL